MSIPLYLNYPSQSKNRTQKTIELKVNLQNPSSEILKENATESSDFIAEELEILKCKSPIIPTRNKNRSLALPIQFNYDNSNKKYSTPKKTEKNYFLKNSLYFSEKKKFRSHQYKPQNILPFQIVNNSINSKPQQNMKNHNFTYFLQSNKKKLHESLNLNPIKNISNIIDLNNSPKKSQHIYEKLFLSKEQNYNYFESPDIRNFYKGILFPEKETQKKQSLIPFKVGKVNIVYHLQNKINRHSKANLDKRFGGKSFAFFDKVEENFESDELSEGVSEIFICQKEENSEKSNYESIIQQQSIIEKNNNSFFDNYFRMEEQK